ncbi:MAG: GC-type dockerin domain-anchored protein [Planctomycetota bacterium]|nr:GC-type dockerin domain-anchored protein [Planctomycetota bacterium]
MKPGNGLRCGALVQSALAFGSRRANLPAHARARSFTRLAFGALIGLSGLASAQTVEWETVAFSGSPAPGTPAGVVFASSFTPPTFDDSGRLGFRANLAGPGVSATNDSGIWLGQPSDLRLIARTGSAAPGLPAGVNYASFGPIVFSNGFAAFTATLTGSGVSVTNNQALFVHANGTTSLVARSGSPAPGTSTGVLFALFSAYALSTDGEVAFRGVLTGTGVNSGNDSGIWRRQPGSSVTIVARESEATGLGTAINFGDLASGSLALNAGGTLHFLSPLAGSGAGTGVTTTLWSAANGTRTAIIRTREAAPGTGANTFFQDLFNPTTLNQDGALAIGASLFGGATPQTNVGIWAGLPENPLLVARAGWDVPGTSVQYQAFASAPVLNDDGVITFASTLRGPGVTIANQTAVLTGQSPEVGIVLRAGDEVPGFPALVIGPTFPSRLLLNRLGQVAVNWSLAGPGVDASNDDALFLVQPTGRPVLMLRQMDTILAGGQLRPVTRYSINSQANSTGGDGRGQAFNAEGRLAVLGEFPGQLAGVLLARLNCQADVDENGSVDFFDYLAFTEAFDANDPAADLTGDGQIDFFDFLEFSTAFARGC